MTHTSAVPDIFRLTHTVASAARAASCLSATQKEFGNPARNFSPCALPSNPIESGGVRISAPPEIKDGFVTSVTCCRNLN
jgi:hypothetical protein